MQIILVLLLYTLCDVMTHYVIRIWYIGILIVLSYIQKFEKKILK